jgi:predicted Zn-dependent protease
MDGTSALNLAGAGDPEASLVRASECEIRRGLNACWRFVSTPALEQYVNPLAARVKRLVAGAPSHCVVELFEDDGLHSLPLPSGTLLLSRGTLESVRDEAELVFLLAHDLAHVARGEAARQLLNGGLRAVSRSDADPDGSAWAEGAQEIVRHGFGEPAEFAADEIAMSVVRSLGYDPDSVARYLERLDTVRHREPSGTDDPARSHPDPAERLRRLEGQIHGAAETSGACRVNREVLRRAFGGEGVPNARFDDRPLEDEPAVASPEQVAPGGRRWVAWTAIGVTTAVTWILLATLLGSCR